MYFVVTSTQDVSIDGIGLLNGGEPRKVTNDELKTFEVLNNTKLAKANFPNFVSVEYVVEEV